MTKLCQIAAFQEGFELTFAADAAVERFTHIGTQAPAHDT